MLGRGLATAVGDEGGFAPDLKSNAEALELMREAAQAAGYAPGKDVAFALDPAASEFYEQDQYVFAKAGRGPRTRENLTELYLDLADRFPIVSLEDGMAENDWLGWLTLTKTLGHRLQLVGDDVFVTNPEIFARGIAEKIANAILIKPNQIGTVTETLDCIAMAKKANYRFVIFHRSGETEDAFIADLAVGTGSGQIKAGAPCRGERIAKYNRLLQIEAELGERAVFATGILG